MGTRSINYPFTTASNYTIGSGIGISNGKALLELQNNPGQSFSNNFDDDTGFTYDNTKSEFSGGVVQQKDTRPSDATLYASFSTDENSSWADGSTSNSLVGGAVWDSGRIDLTGGTGKRLNMPALGNFDNLGGSGSRGCIRFTYMPNYNGAPTVGGHILELDTPTGNNNAIFIRHYGGGAPPDYISIDLRDSSGTSHWMYTSAKSFTQGQEYVFELNFDFDGVSRFFFVGVLEASLNTSSWTRVNDTGTFKWGGDSGTGDFYIKDIILFSEVQHTSEHAGELPFSYNNTIYVENTVILPEMEYTGAGNLVTFDSLVTSETDAPKYTVQLGRSGNYVYWNGSAWVTSDGSYSQSTDVSTFSSNLASLSVSGESYLQFKVHFGDSNTQSNVDILTASLTGQIYPTDDPIIYPNTTFTGDQLLSYSMTATISGNDGIGHILAKNDVNYYYDTVNEVWAVSDGTYAKSNTAVEIETNKASFLSEGFGAVITPKWILHSDDGSTTPQLDLIEISYDFFGGDVTCTDVCTVYGHVIQDSVAVEGATITFTPNLDVSICAKKNILVANSYHLVSNSNGYWEQDIPETVSLDIKYTVIIHYQNSSGTVYHREYNNIIIPNQVSVNFGDLIE